MSGPEKRRPPENLTDFNHDNHLYNSVKRCLLALYRGGDTTLNLDQLVGILFDRPVVTAASRETDNYDPDNYLPLPAEEYVKLHSQFFAQKNPQFVAEYRLHQNSTPDQLNPYNFLARLVDQLERLTQEGWISWYSFTPENNRTFRIHNPHALDDTAPWQPISVESLDLEVDQEIYLLPSGIPEARELDDTQPSPPLR